MWLNVTSDDQTLFYIEYKTKDKTEDAVLFKKEDSWHFTPRSGAESVWVANGKISWPEALKRVLINVSSMA